MLWRSCEVVIKWTYNSPSNTQNKNLAQDWDNPVWQKMFPEGFCNVRPTLVQLFHQQWFPSICCPHTPVYLYASLERLQEETTPPPLWSEALGGLVAEKTKAKIPLRLAKSLTVTISPSPPVLTPVSRGIVLREYPISSCNESYNSHLQGANPLTGVASLFSSSCLEV